MAAGRRRKRLTGTVSAVLACTTLAGGCSQPVSGIPSAANNYAANETAGLPATDGPSGPRADAPDPRLPVAGTDRGETDKLASRAVTDVQNYWSDAFPAEFDGERFTPVRKLVSYDSDGRGTTFCGQRAKNLANAFYCPGEDGIAWDRGGLLPTLEDRFGPLATVTVLAQEMGHAVQARAETVGPDEPAIVREQQADCFTGSYFRHVADGKSEHFRVSTGGGLNDVLSVLNLIRDAPGENDVTSDAHGNAIDRIGAFQSGFADGPGRCTEMTEETVNQHTTQLGPWKADQDAELPVDRRALAAVEDSLREVFHDVGARPPRVTTDPTDCGPREATTPATYCPETNTVSVDMVELREAAGPPGESHAGVEHGDFAAHAQVAARYALSIQDSAGMPLDDAQAGLRTACYVGAWSGQLMADPAGQHNSTGQLRVTPDDINQGVTALLGEDSLIAADVHGRRTPAGFARVEAFRTGFDEGLNSCGTKYLA